MLDNLQCEHNVPYYVREMGSVASPAQKSGGPNNFSLLVSSQMLQYTTWDPIPIYIKHFSSDLRKSQEGSEHKWGSGPTHPPWRRHWMGWEKVIPYKDTKTKINIGNRQTAIVLISVSLTPDVHALPLDGLEIKKREL